jgi:hypothetical protein
VKVTFGIRRNGIVWSQPRNEILGESNIELSANNSGQNSFLLIQEKGFGSSLKQDLLTLCPKIQIEI